MKNLKGITYGFALFIAFYLIGAFVQTDFNIKNWSELARMFVGVLGGGISILIAIVIYTTEYEESMTS